MKIDLVVSVVCYELAIILGMSFWLRWRDARQVQQEGDFQLAGRRLPFLLVAITLAKTVLGTAHILGQFEMAFHMGAVAIWFSIAHVIMLVVVCQGTGIWVRRLRVTTVTEVLDRLYGRGVRLMTSVIMVGTLFGILTVEAQGMGIIFASMTGWDIRTGAIMGGTLGILYVVLAGMKEIGYVNLVNAVVMYAGVIVATIFLALHLPGGDFSSIAQYYNQSGQSAMLSIYGTPEFLWTFGLGTTIAVVFCVGFGQGVLQPAMAADSEDTVRRAMWISAPLNGMFGVFAIVIGLTARAIPQFQALGPKMAATSMLVAYLPGWLSAVLLAAFLAAVLSTFAIVALGAATLVSVDFYRNLWYPGAGEKQMALVTRCVIVLMASVAIAMATSLPTIVPMMNWLFSWSIPIFWIAIFGLFWKRRALAAQGTLISAWVANSLWSFTPLPYLLHLPATSNIYVTLGVTLVVAIAANLLLPGEPGYFKSAEYLRQTEATERVH